MSIAGLDVSQWQGAINWAEVPASYQWVAIRALRGSVLDTRFYANWAGARARGFPHRLAYAYVTGADILEQAQALLTLVAPLRAGEGLMLDFEDPPVTNAQASVWLNAVESVTSRPAVVYVGGARELKIARLDVVGNRALVWPAYTPEDRARASLPGRTWDAWQFTDRGTVPGIAGPVDLDRVDNPSAFDVAVGGPMAFTIKPVVLPLCLEGQSNGRLDQTILAPIPSERDSNTGYQMVIPAARAYRAMHAAAKAKGLTLKPVSAADTYRPYAVQLSIYQARYAVGGTCGGCKTCAGFGRRCKKRQANGSCPATAACPGTSNHGWGLAVDIGVETDGDVAAESIGTASRPTPELTWLGNNADLFGFSWETLPEEYWHLRHYRGDDLAPAVLAYEASLEPVPPPPPPPPPPDDITHLSGLEVARRCFSEEDEVRLIRKDGTGELWVTNGLCRRHVPSVHDRDHLIRTFNLQPVQPPAAPDPALGPHVELVPAHADLNNGYGPQV